MEYRRLGDTGLMVSELCLGCMTFGREASEEDSKRLVDRFLDAGGNFIDTVDVYSKGVSEEITGRAIKEIRDDVVLATKGYFPMGEGPNDTGLSRKRVTQGCEDSLRRLGTDYIDLYQVHCWDSATPLKETLSALTDLVRSGKVRYIGVSNFTGWQLVKSVCLSEANGLERFVCLQPQYSLVERNIEREILPICLEEGLGVIPWSPLGGGFLSGRYSGPPRRIEPGRDRSPDQGVRRGILERRQALGGEQPVPGVSSSRLGAHHPCSGRRPRLRHGKTAARPRSRVHAPACRGGRRGSGRDLHPWTRYFGAGKVPQAPGYRQPVAGRLDRLHEQNVAGKRNEHPRDGE